MSGKGSKVKKGGKKAKKVAEAPAKPASNGDFKIVLSNGTMMPTVAICTYRIRKIDDVMKVVNDALGAGYRSFETGPFFKNETHMKEAFRVLLPKYGLNRDDIFVTTRFTSSDYRLSDVVDKKFTKSLENLGLEYIDLYLVHYPACVLNNASDPRSQKIRDMTWAATEELCNSIRVNAVGVYNFTIKLLEDLARNHRPMPAVNQVDPSHHQPELIKYCKDKNIVVQASCTPNAGPSLVKII